MVTPKTQKHSHTRSQLCLSPQFLFFFSNTHFSLHPFLSPEARVHQFIDTFQSGRWALWSLLFDATFLPFRSGSLRHLVTLNHSLRLLLFGKKGSAEKGNQAHKGRWINRHLMAPAIQVKYSTVWTHPPYHPSPSTHLPSTLHFSPSTHRNPPVLCLHAPESLTGSHPIFTSHHHIPVCFIPINNERDSDWVKINNSEPIKWGLADIPPDAFTKARQSFGGSYKRCV